MPSDHPNNINESNHSNGGKNGENIDTDNNDKDGSYDDNAELLKWKVIMVKLASAQQQAEERPGRHPDADEPRHRGHEQEQGADEDARDRAGAA